MPPYVLEMSTNTSITNTPLDATWNGRASQRYSWGQVKRGGLNIPNDAIIVVIAHGNAQQIGNTQGSLGISPVEFVALIQGSMQQNSEPEAIYISVCGTGLAEFAAQVRTCMQDNSYCLNTTVYGHDTSVSGPVPPPVSVMPNSHHWTEFS